jgi:hypothetical protein
MSNDRQVRKQLDRILKLRIQYRTVREEATRINKLAGVELKKLEKLLR